jgi:hypothetical protein
MPWSRVVARGHRATLKVSSVDKTRPVLSTPRSGLPAELTLRVAGGEGLAGATSRAFGRAALATGSAGFRSRMP